MTEIRTDLEVFLEVFADPILELQDVTTAADIEGGDR